MEGSGRRPAGSSQGHSHGGCSRIETGRIEFAADLGVRPDLQLAVLFVGRAGEDLLELLVARVTTAVLRRTGALAFDADRVGPASLGLGGRFDEQFVFPAIAEVIFVAERPSTSATLASRTFVPSRYPSVSSGSVP